MSVAKRLWKARVQLEKLEGEVRDVIERHVDRDLLHYTYDQDGHHIEVTLLSRVMARTPAVNALFESLAATGFDHVTIRVATPYVN